MKTFFYLFVGYWFLVGTNFWAQESEQKYQFVNIKEIVSKIGVNTIIQDHYGFIWMGTNGGGINKFDGINYTSYKNSLADTTSVSNNIIHCSYKDHKNRLWFGTNGGLNLYNRKKNQFTRISLSDFKENKTNISVRSLMGDGKGNLFIGTFELGLFKLNLANFKVEKIKNQELTISTPITIHSLQADSNGKIYAGTGKGLKEFDIKTNTLKFSKFKTEKGVETINDPIQKLLITNNNLWVGTISSGLFEINNVTGQKNLLNRIHHFSFTKNRFMSIINLPDGSLMCGIENDGLIHIRKDGSVINHYLSKKTDAKGILVNSIWSLFLDNNERIWIGYHNAGIAIYDKLHDKFKDIESLPNNSNSLQIGSVTSIVKDPLGNFWIGLDGGGIDVFNPKSNQFTHINSSKNNLFSGLTNDYIESIFIDSKQNIWLGSWGNGLYLLKKGSKKFINYTIKNTKGGISSDYILSITEGLDGTIWFSNWDKGLHSYNPDTNKFVHHTSEPFIKTEYLIVSPEKF